MSAAARFRFSASAEQLAAKNRAIYDDATDSFWRLAVYGPLHGGLELANLGGRRVLDDLATRAALGPGRGVLELCCGMASNCRYLVERTGCRAVGLELNRRQVERARRRLQAVDGLAGRLEVVLGDAAAWQPPRRFDLVFTLDSLMLVGDLEGALDTACRALAPAGLLALVEIVAGARVSEATRRFVWETDGMLNLPSPAEYADLLGARGLGAAAVDDLTPLAVAAQDVMLDALAREREAIVAEDGAEMHERCVDLGRRYRAAFATGELAYVRLASRAARDEAHRPA